MRLLKILCVIFSLLLIAASITGIGSFMMGPSGTTIVRLDNVSRTYALVSSFILAAFAYGIHRKARITWPAGFFLLMLTYIGFASVPLLALSKARGGDVGTALTIVVGGAVAIFWGLWWKRQRSYSH